MYMAPLLLKTSMFALGINSKETLTITKERVNMPCINTICLVLINIPCKNMICRDIKLQVDLEGRENENKTHQTYQISNASEIPY